MSLNPSSTAELHHAIRTHRTCGCRAFNHPFNLIVHQVTLAIAVGCPVVVKPADITPYRALPSLISRTKPDCRRNGAKSWCRRTSVVSALRRTNAMLSSVLSVRRGLAGCCVRNWRQNALRAGTRRRRTGYSGGRCGSDDVMRLAKGGFYHAGQVCVSVQRIFVHSSIAEKAAEGLAGLAKMRSEIRLGGYRSRTVDSYRRSRQVDEWVQAAIAGGAKCLTGGEKLSILVTSRRSCSIRWRANVSTMEIFGPVICVYAYDDIDEAIEQATLCRFPSRPLMTKDTIRQCVSQPDRRNGRYGERAHGLPRRLMPLPGARRRATVSAAFRSRCMRCRSRR